MRAYSVVVDEHGDRQRLVKNGKQPEDRAVALRDEHGDWTMSAPLLGRGHVTVHAAIARDAVKDHLVHRLLLAVADYEAG